MISNSPASMELRPLKATRLRSELAREVEEVRDRHEVAGTLRDPEYLAAAVYFYALHMCRIVQNPPEV